MARPPAGATVSWPECESKGSAMRSDNEHRRDVERELEWEPAVDERRTVVSVLDGVVTLTGDVPTSAQRWKVERTVQRVESVRGVVNELEVHLATEVSDTDVARAAVDALKSDITAPSDRSKVKVSNGWVTLSGDVTRDFERRAAERAVRDLAGAAGVSNSITIQPPVKPQNVKSMIEETVKREATLDARSTIAEVSGTEVTLRGTVRSWLERHEAETAAWAAPGVTAVHNHITVESPAYAA
jgi:osmotically-inducible protein OsmY